jgi:uncharacterized protein
MNRTFNAAVAALIFAIGFAATVAAGPFEDGNAAYWRGDYATAMRLWRPLADQGNAGAQYALGFMYRNGQGVQQDYTAALRCYRKAADQGYAEAQTELGLLYLNGLGVRQDYAAALSWYRKAADQGSAGGQTGLAIIFLNGLGVRKDHAAAASWLRKAADQGHAEAQNGLGFLYGTGQGVPQDYTAAASWYRKAADQGEAKAQSNLGDLYAYGYGVLQDHAAAATWYLKAADQGNAQAQSSLGGMYFYGYGVRQDYVSAHMWYNLAAAKGENDAEKHRDFAAAQMTPAQLAEAQKRAAEWRPKMANAPPTQVAPAPRAAKESDPEEFSGSAFFVSKDGKALTNAHVVQQCQQISVNTDGHSHDARVLARDDKNDLALLATDLHPLQTANWRLQVRQGEDIVVYGFPLTGALASSGNVTTGNVTALAGIADDSRFLQISAPVQPGNSGGPLLDRNGTVVGVIVSKLNALSVASVTGDIPQNVNFAIKASVAAAFLDAQRVTHAESAGAGALSTPDLAERARSFTVQVVCIR